MAHVSQKNRLISSIGLISLLSVVGCGTSNSGTTGDAGAGGSQTSDGGGENDAGTGGSSRGWCGCLASYVTIYLDVSAASDAGAISGVEATLSGPAMVTMSCDQRGAVTVCRWPSDIYTVTAGSYSLAVSAPGFQTANVSATVTLGTTDCGCVPATLEPSTVILDPS